MAGKIEDCAIIGDTSTVALVDRSGSIDWWCAPRIDSNACFAALLGDQSNGRWIIAPRGPTANVSRRYEPDTLVLDTLFETAEGSVAILEFMPPQHANPTIHRVVEGRSGTVKSTWGQRSASTAARSPGLGVVVPTVRTSSMASSCSTRGVYHAHPHGIRRAPSSPRTRRDAVGPRCTKERCES